MSALKDILEGIARPLDFAARHDGANLGVIRDFEPVLGGALAAALPHATPAEKPVILQMMELVRGFDAMPLEEKRARIRSFAGLYERLLHPPAPPAPAPAAPSPAAAPPPAHAGTEGLATPIKFIKGVGPRIAGLFAARQIFTVGDALRLFPRAYEDRRNVKAIPDLREKETATVIGQVVVRDQAGRRAWEMVIGDGRGHLSLKWFHYNHAFLGRLKTDFTVGDTVVASGKVSAYRGQFQIVHPTIRKAEAFEDDDLNYRRIVPLYPKVEGISEGHLLRIMQRVVEGYAGFVAERLPAEVRAARGLMAAADAVRAIHFPPDDAVIDALGTMDSPPRRSLAYEEFFLLEAGLAMKKARTEAEPGIAFAVPADPASVLQGLVPFALTGAQRRVLAGIAADMARPAPMNRLLQGDVGSGKTAVAFAAMLIAVQNGCQAVMLAPTEILAAQHFKNLVQYARGKIGIALLTGAVKGAARARILEGLSAGTVQIAVGTHAVLEEQVVFKRLGLAVIDEQHRFGVLQRAEIRRKGLAAGGCTPDVLVMTATPIPRTLAMSLYGDLDLSIIDELPPGRTPVMTKVYYDGQQKKCHELMEREIAAGRQCYIVYPLVEESEKIDLKDATRMAGEFKERIFPHRRVGLLHGRMKDDEKEAVMARFKAGELDILVSTTVIEVGVDVPNASVMVVEHAERFGLSQLHQLRGRVGRGAAKSHCLLVARYQRSEEAARRLRVMEKTTDGFKIAEEDLQIRGPGEFMGTRQSGIPDLQMSTLTLGTQVLAQAREDAFALVRADPDLSAPDHRALRRHVLQFWGDRIDLSKVG